MGSIRHDSTFVSLQKKPKTIAFDSAQTMLRERQESICYLEMPEAAAYI